ncbi:MAG: SDR family oxidoreductase [Thermonemataceae bacterium]|nr:SDR family oxidoreductase [Thermonemataceae bacterium]
MRKTYLVVGGSSGIGLATTKLLVQNGHSVWVASRNFTEELQNLGIKHITWDVNEAADNRFEGIESLDGLVYCPGTINLKPFHRLSRQDFQNELNINVLGAIDVLQQTFKQLKNAPNGASVVLFSTVAATLGMNFHASIATAKGALEGLAKSLAAEWAGAQIRVNVIAPSLTDTPLAAKLLAGEDKKDAANKRHPLGRVGKAEDLAEMTYFLLSEKSSWITGQIIGVDGGMGSLK